jgi:hypothetical protein
VSDADGVSATTLAVDHPFAVGAWLVNPWTFDRLLVEPAVDGTSRSA